MRLNNNYILVEKYDEPKEEGFKTVEVQDNFVYKGRVKQIPEVPIYMGNDHIKVGDIIMFAKYSPDTHEIEVDGKKLKFVSQYDILCIYESH